jgi:hypothetical protein
MTKPVSPKSAWTKPELVKLGKIADVAGNAVINNNGTSVNLKS